MVRFLCAQPSELYFAWQVEVMLNNFIEMGINLEYVDIVSTKKNNKIPEIWKNLSNAYNARFFFLRRHSNRKILHIVYTTEYFKTTF